MKYVVESSNKELTLSQKKKTRPSKLPQVFVEGWRPQKEKTGVPTASRDIATKTSRNKTTSAAPVLPLRRNAYLEEVE